VYTEAQQQDGRSAGGAGGSWSGHGARRPGRQRRRGRAAQDGVLRRELPGRGARGGRLRPAARPPRAHRRRRVAPAALPRLLRQGTCVRACACQRVRRPLRGVVPVRALTAGVCMCVMCPTTRSLVPAGLRRLRPAQLHRRQRGREGRAAEPDAARLRPRRPRQGARRGCLPRRRLLRRRPRARRPGRGRRHRA
jgi:hypothetical protein